MTFVQKLKAIKEAGIIAVPVPGTSKYYIRFQDGKSILIGERTFMQLVASMHDHESIETTLKNYTLQPQETTLATGRTRKISLS